MLYLKSETELYTIGSRKYKQKTIRPSSDTETTFHIIWEIQFEDRYSDLQREA